MVTVQALREMTTERLIEYMGNTEPGSIAHGHGLTELQYRQMLIQLDATDAQKVAAQAETRAADAAERNAKYVLISVIIAAVSAVSSAAAAYFAYAALRVPH